MRQTLALFVLVLCAGCGDNTTPPAPDLAMSVPADLAPGPDLAVRVPDGVACGQMTCAVGQTCCVMTSGNMATGATCVASSAQCSGGAALACDGPEDCGGSKFCCGTVKLAGGAGDGGLPMFNGGNASCTTSCNFNLGTGEVTTRLCHADVDCAGLTGFGMALDRCCSSAMVPGLHICAAPIPLAGINCP